MGFGISSFVSRGTRKALIRWIDPENNNESDVYDNSNEESIFDPKSIMQNAKQFLTLALVGDLATNSITPDVRKSEVHKFRSNVTETAMEDGSIVSQHVIQRPIEITLQFEETNSGKISDFNFGGKSVAGLIGKTATFDKLVDIWTRKIPVQIITEQAQYDNMVIESMPIIHKQPYKGALQIMCDFKQLNFYTAGTFPYKGKSKNINKSVSPRVEGGTQTTSKVGG